MNAGPSDPEAGYPSEANDPLWNLLGEAPLREPDAWFAMRTISRCRREVAAVESRWVLSQRLWRWTMGGCLGVAVGMTLIGAQVHADKLNKQKSVQEAFEVMATIDSDADSSSSSSSWSDTSL